MMQAREIRRRIKTIKKTAQMTHAMELVAAAKMRRAQEAARAARPYSQTLETMLQHLLRSIKPNAHPLMQKRAVKHTTLLFTTPDRGLCGALNANLARALLLHPDILTARSESPVSLITIGKRGQLLASRLEMNLELDYERHDPPQFEGSVQLAKTMINRFQKHATDRVLFLYPHFASTMKQEIRVKTILPIMTFEVTGELGEAHTVSSVLGRQYLQYGFEPTSDAVLEATLPHYVEMWIYQIFLEASACEHSSRMIAMKEATDNAKGLESDLTLMLNRVRQEAITNELLDLTSAGVALGGK
ncbi:MAG: ATP synthase F1 subunit gamma [bacterium]|nr:ATP synthase F1 subunit gamma [bacterium]